MTKTGEVFSSIAVKRREVRGGSSGDWKGWVWGSSLGGSVEVWGQCGSVEVAQMWARAPTPSAAELQKNGCSAFTDNPFTKCPDQRKIVGERKKSCNWSDFGFSFAPFASSSFSVISEFELKNRACHRKRVFLKKEKTDLPELMSFCFICQHWSWLCNHWLWTEGWSCLCDHGSVCWCARIT